MDEEQMRRVRGFAAGLSALKAKSELGHGCTLTADEVAGVIWGIKKLTVEARRGSRDAAAESA